MEDLRTLPFSRSSVEASVELLVTADRGLDGTIAAETPISSSLGAESSVEELSIWGTTSQPTSPGGFVLPATLQG